MASSLICCEWLLCTAFRLIRRISEYVMPYHYSNDANLFRLVDCND
jgi:hypothetical protein